MLGVDLVMVGSASKDKKPKTPRRWKNQSNQVISGR